MKIREKRKDETYSWD